MQGPTGTLSEDFPCTVCAPSIKFYIFTGMDYWSGVLDWTTGMGGVIFFKHAHDNQRFSIMITRRFGTSKSLYIIGLA